MYKCKHFKIQELVPKAIYQKFGEAAWHLIDERLCITLDALVEKFGAMVCNTWAAGGDKQQRGLRTPDCPDYSQTSMHVHGKAADLIPLHATVDEIRKYILANPHEFPYITGVELDVPWLHVDTRNVEQIQTFSKPK